MAALTGGPHTIVLQDGGGKYEEGPLTTAGSPGMNVVMTAAVENLMRDSYAAGIPLSTANHLKVLREDQLQGRSIDTAYSIGDNCFIYCAVPGDVILALVKTGETVTKAAGLSPDATGKWIVDATTPKAQALEASGGALAVDTHIRCRIL